MPLPFEHETQWMRLAGLDGLDGAESIDVMPARSARIRDAFVAFPTESHGLIRPPVPPVDVICPPVRLVRVPEVRVYGFRLLRSGDRFFNDHSLVAPVAARHDLKTKLGSDFTENIPFSASGPLVTGAPLDVDGPILVLSSDEPANFGSWLFRFLPKLILTRQRAGTHRVFVHAVRDWMQRLLELVDPEVEIVQHVPRRSYRIREPLIATLVAPDKYWRPELHDAFAPIVERACAAHPDTPEKIYVSRRGQSLARPALRVMENETELVERLLPSGFVEFVPEDHPIGRQIATLAQARVIVSPGGSNLFGCYFARNAELIVDVESSMTWLHAHANVLASCGRPYSIVRGVQTERGTGRYHRNWVADIDCLLDGLKRLGVA